MYFISLLELRDFSLSTKAVNDHLRTGQGRTATERLRGLKNAKCNLYLIEEPTIGLHMADAKRFIDSLHRLADEGHTTVVIEHHPEVFAEGGLLVPQGTPGLLSLRRYQTEGWQILIF